MTCAKRTKTRSSISRKICCVKSGSQILYAVEHLSSLFSKDKLKQGAHIHQTHDSPSPRISWENCRAVASQQLPRKCRVELALASAGKGLLYTSLPRSLTDGCTMLMCSSNGETAVHGCHCPRDMAVRMREVMARPWAGLVYVCPLLNFTGNS